MVLAAAALLLMTTACNKNTEMETEDKAQKTEVTMMYFSQLPAFEKLVESSYEDIDLVVEQNASATLNSESERRLRHGHGSDLIMTTLPDGVVSDYTYDISAEDFVLNYSGAITKSLLVDGQTRYVPLPGQYYGYIINETFAEELGFELPENTGDILELLAAAQEKGVGTDTDGSCLGFHNIGDSYFANTVIGNWVPDFLAQPEGIIWLSDLQEGNATFSGEFDHCLDFLLECAEKGYFNAGSVLASNSITIANRNAVDVEARMLERKLILSYGNIELYRELSEKSEGDRFNMLPFLSSGENPGWLNSMGNGYLAVNQKLGEEGQEQKLEAALKILALLSTEEGQEAWMQDTKANISYLEDVAVSQEDIPDGIREAVENGCIFTSTLPNSIAQYFGQQMNMVLTGRTEMADALNAVDDYYTNGSDEVDYDQSVVGSVSEDLIYENYNTRKEETAIGNLVADAVKEYSGAQIVLVNGGSIRASLYAGDITGADLAAVCPYTNQIITVKATGATLKEALANGISQTDRGEEVPGGRFLQVSGICYSYRPMKDAQDSGELLDVTLPDGEPIDDDEEYLVAVNDYMAGSSTYVDGNGDGFVMLNVYDDSEPKSVSLENETAGTYRDALKAYFAEHEADTITSELEGRITVVE